MTHFSKINESWEMHITANNGITCYDISTNSWFYRGWKVYSEDKELLVLSWSIELICNKGKLDVREILSPESWVRIITSNTPHIFYSWEESRFLEWFPESATSKDFERFRQMKK